MFLQCDPLLDYNAVDFHMYMGTGLISVLLDEIEDSGVRALGSILFVW